MTDTARHPGGFSIARGAPFLRLQERAGLLAHGSLAPRRRAIVFALLCWLPLLVLAVAAGDAGGADRARPFLSDIATHVRYLLAVPVLLLMEPLADARIGETCREFLAGGIVPPTRLRDFDALVADAHRRRDSGAAEALLLALALLAGSATVRGSVRLNGSTWAGALGPDGLVHLGAAGWWAATVAAPILSFLGLRWLWRYSLWARLLARIARLDLDVVPTHPDRCGGLGVVAQYPSVFALFAFAASAVVAAAMAGALLRGAMRIEDLQAPMVLWVVFIALLFSLPLLAFTGPLRRAKRRGLREFAALSSHHDRAFRERWFGGGADPAAILGGPDASSLADLAAGYQAVKAMRPVPLVAEGIVPVVAACAVPLLCAVATQVPVRTMLEVARRIAL